jgi:NTE family protein
MAVPAKHKLGLSLSGGGYRAAVFHLGTLKKLQQLNILQQVDVLSTISGGSITGAYYCLNKDDFDKFEKELYNFFQTKSVIKKVLLSGTFLQLILFSLFFLAPAFYFLFTSTAWLFLVFLGVFIILLLRFQFYIFPVSKRIEKIYDNFFFNKKCLGNLPDKPTLVVGSTNLQTACPFTFSKTWMQDSAYQYMEPAIKFKASGFPISRAVMASSCVPFAFTPIKIDKQFFQEETDAKKVHPLLVDGGVYDNQGIHKIVQGGYYSCKTVITSDAGCGSSGEISLRNTITLLLNTVDVFMSRIKKAQMVQYIYDNAGAANRQIAYFSLGWDVERCIPGFIDNLDDDKIVESVIIAHQLKPEWVKKPRIYEIEITNWLKSRTDYDKIIKPTTEEKFIARKVGTNLTALSKSQVDCLIKQAECLTELQIKLYCPSLLI